jgi:hypothetical protein
MATRRTRQEGIDHPDRGMRADGSLRAIPSPSFASFSI